MGDNPNERIEEVNDVSRQIRKDILSPLIVGYLHYIGYKAMN